MAMSRQEKIEAALATLSPSHLEVVNESHMHSSGSGESHFKVVVVADAFAGERLVARHRRINALLVAELAGGLHALSIHALSPAEWQAGGHDLSSPACRGGAGK